MKRFASAPWRRTLDFSYAAACEAQAAAINAPLDEQNINVGGTTLERKRKSKNLVVASCHLAESKNN